MIYGHIDEHEQWAFLDRHPVWCEAFAWLRRLPTNPEIGKIPLRGDDMFALVMRYETGAPEDSRFETHRKFIDLQYTISGGEVIGWARSASLDKEGPYDIEKDLQFYRYKRPVSMVHKKAGHFSIYHPSDAHLPKIHDGEHAGVFKAVIKIGRHLVV